MSASPDYYESTGTIHLKIEGQETKDEGGKTEIKAKKQKMKTKKTEIVFFVPDKDHRVKHQGKEYAVFLPEGLCTDEGSCEDAKVSSFKKCLNNSVELILSICNCKMNTVFTALLDAAINQSTVDVKVKLDGKKLKLIGITVPALSGK